MKIGDEIVASESYLRAIGERFNATEIKRVASLEVYISAKKEEKKIWEDIKKDFPEACENYQIKWDGELKKLLVYGYQV